MATAPQSTAYVVPDPTTPKTVGVLNIIFGTLLGLCGICYGFEAVSLMFMGPMMKGFGQQVQADMERQVKAQVEAEQEALDDAEDAEKKDAGKKAAGQNDAAEGAGNKVPAQPNADEKAGAEGQPPPEGKPAEGQPPAPPRPPIVMPMMPDMSEIFKLYDDPRMTGFAMADAATGMILNLLLLISGAGLLMLRPWGRSLALWTAWLKIGRLIIVYTFAIFVTIPIASKAMGAMAEKMIAQAPGGGGAGGPPPGTLTSVYAIMWTVMAVGLVLIGAIYPAISLWLLGKPAAKAACRTAAPPSTPSTDR